MKEQTTFPDFGVSPVADNTIVAYVNGKAIVEDEWGDLYFCEMPQEVVTVGEIADMQGFQTISELSSNEINEILRVLDR